MIFSRQNLLRIVVPLIISQTLSVAIGMEDSIMDLLPRQSRK